MKVFLLSCLAVALIGAGAYFGLERFAARNAGDDFAVARSTRVSDSDKPDPRGFTAFRHQPAGGITSGRSPSGGPGAQPRP